MMFFVLICYVYWEMRRGLNQNKIVIPQGPDSLHRLVRP